MLFVKSTVSGRSLRDSSVELKGSVRTGLGVTTRLSLVGKEPKTRRHTTVTVNTMNHYPAHD